jgi:hypothetical protein
VPPKNEPRRSGAQDVQRDCPWRGTKTLSPCPWRDNRRRHRSPPRQNEKGGTRAAPTAEHRTSGPRCDSGASERRNGCRARALIPQPGGVVPPAPPAPHPVEMPLAAFFPRSCQGFLIRGASGAVRKWSFGYVVAPDGTRSSRPSVPHNADVGPPANQQIAPASPAGRGGVALSGFPMTQKGPLCCSRVTAFPAKMQ